MLILYTSHPPEIYKPIIKEFETHTGIWVQVEVGGTQELLERISSKNETISCDIMFGSSSEALQVIIFNTKLVSERECPTTWRSLTDPKWHGRIAFADPHYSASSYTALATFLQIYGTEGWPPISNLLENLAGHFLVSSKDVITQVEIGTFPVGITLECTAKTALTQGLNIGYLYSENVTSCSPDGTAIVKNTPRLKNAQLFVDFTTSYDVQMLLAQTLHRRPIRNDLVSSLGDKGFSAINVIDHNINTAIHHQESIL